MENFRDCKVQPKYTGEIKNGKPDGVGISFHSPDEWERVED